METLKPRNENECIEIVKWAVSEKKPLEIMSGGTKRKLGGPVEAAALIDVSALAGISLYEPDELVMTAGPGTSLADIEKALRENDQGLAFEPADYGPLFGKPRGATTIGGILAGNISGPRRLKAGAARDHFLGARAISGRGELFKAGGRVVKNVTGYDLCKVLAGSWGTLAILTETTIKVLPAGQKIFTVLVSGLTDRDAVGAMAKALGSTFEVSGAAHIPVGMMSGIDAEKTTEAVTALRVEGIRPSVEYRASGLVELLANAGECQIVKTTESQKFWRNVRDCSYFTHHLDRPLWRISVAPTDGPDVVAAVSSKADISAFYDWAGGLVWMEIGADYDGDGGAEIVREAVDATGGHATLIRANDNIRAGVEVFHPQEPVLAGITARLKNGFDPENILNPGRMYGGV